VAPLGHHPSPEQCPPCGQGFEFEIELRQVIATRCRDEVPEALRRRIAESIGVEWTDTDPV